MFFTSWPLGIRGPGKYSREFVTGNPAPILLQLMATYGSPDSTDALTRLRQPLFHRGVR